VDLAAGHANFPGRWRAIKIAFAKSLPVCEPRSAVMTGRGERGIWQRRYWEHTIRDDWDFAVHFDYIHFNPVKHGLVKHPSDWPHSSFRRCVANGLYPAGWTGGSDEPRQTGDRLSNRGGRSSGEGQDRESVRGARIATGFGGMRCPAGQARGLKAVPPYACCSAC
jgi:hypothetical protein